MKIKTLYEICLNSATETSDEIKNHCFTDILIKYVENATRDIRELNCYNTMSNDSGRSEDVIYRIENTLTKLIGVPGMFGVVNLLEELYSAACNEGISRDQNIRLSKLWMEGL